MKELHLDIELAGLEEKGDWLKELDRVEGVLDGLLKQYGLTEEGSGMGFGKRDWEYEIPEFDDETGQGLSPERLAELLTKLDELKEGDDLIFRTLRFREVEWDPEDEDDEEGGYV